MTSVDNDDKALIDRGASLARDVRNRFWIVAGIVVAILLVLLLPVLGGGYYVMDDMGSNFLPLRIYYASHLANRESVAWSPHMFGGYYLLGDAHLGMYHPAIHLLYRLVPFRWAFPLETFARYPLVLAGTFLLLRRWGVPADASLFGGATLSFGFFLMHFHHVALINVAAHLPWLLVAADILVRDESRQRARWAWLAVVLLTASQWLIGSPPLAYMSAQAESIYVLVLWATGQIRRGRLPVWVIAKLLGGLVACPQILATMEAIRVSRRAGATISWVLEGSLHPADLLQLFSPLWFKGGSYKRALMANETALSCGSVATVLAAWALVRWRHLGRLRPWAGIAVVLTVIGLLFAMAEFGGLAVLHYYLPVVGKIRNPARYIMIAQLGIAGLAAIGLAEHNLARANGGREPRALWFLLLVPLSLLFWLAAALAMNGFHPPERFVARVASVLIFVTSFLLVCASARRVRFAFPLVVGIAFAEPVFYAMQYYAWMYLKPSERTADLSLYGPPVMTLEAYYQLFPPCPARGRERVSGVLDELNLIRDVYSILGYAALEPERFLDYRRPAAERVAGVRWRLRKENAEGAWEEVAKPWAGIRRGLRYRGPRLSWEETAEPLPYFRLVGRAIASEDPGQALETIDPSTTAVVFEPLDLPPGDQGTAVLERDSPGHLEIVTSAPSQRLIVVAESYHPGWQVLSEGQWQRPIRVYGDFLGFVVPGGQHRVTFEFRPWTVRLGLWLSLIGLALALALFGGSWVGVKRRALLSRWVGQSPRPTASAPN